MLEAPTAITEKITLRYSHLFHKQFVMCLEALKKTRFRDYRSPRNALKILKEVDKYIMQSREEYAQKLEPFFAKDENGEFINKPTDISQYQLIEGKENEYRQALADFLNTEFVIDCDKVNPDMIMEARLTPTMVAILADIFDDKI